MRRLARRGARGQALVEVALVAPLFFLTVFGIIDIARVIWANDVTANAAREGARYASVHAGTVTLTTRATKEEIRAQTLNYLIAGGIDAKVTVCFSAVQIASKTSGCTGDTDQPGAVYDRGNLVTVVVTTAVPVVTGALAGHPDFTVSGTSTVLVNN